MKTFRVLTSWLMVLVCLSLATASCSSDDDTEEEIEAGSIVGTWTYKLDGNEDTVTFSSNGTCKMVLKAQGTTITTQGTYVYEDDVITIFVNGTYAGAWKVISVTSKTLTLESEDQGGATITYQRA